MNESNYDDRVFFACLLNNTGDTIAKKYWKESLATEKVPQKTLIKFLKQKVLPTISNNVESTTQTLSKILMVKESYLMLVKYKHPMLLAVVGHKKETENISAYAMRVMDKLDERLARSKTATSTPSKEEKEALFSMLQAQKNQLTPAKLKHKQQGLKKAMMENIEEAIKMEGLMSYTLDAVEDLKLLSEENNILTGKVRTKVYEENKAAILIQDPMAIFDEEGERCHNAVSPFIRKVSNLCNTGLRAMSCPMSIADMVPYTDEKWKTMQYQEFPTFKTFFITSHYSTNHVLTTSKGHQVQISKVIKKSAHGTQMWAFELGGFIKNLHNQNYLAVCKNATVITKPFDRTDLAQQWCWDGAHLINKESHQVLRMKNYLVSKCLLTEKKSDNIAQVWVLEEI